MRNPFVLIRVALGSVLIFMALTTSGQNLPQPPSHLPPFDQSGQEPNPAQGKMERDAAKKAAKERQAAIKRDTDKLLELATQLKENVDKSSENTLSMDVVKKAEEIERLAKSVKDKMRGN